MREDLESCVEMPRRRTAVRRANSVGVDDRCSWPQYSSAVQRALLASLPRCTWRASHVQVIQASDACSPERGLRKTCARISVQIDRGDDVAVAEGLRLEHSDPFGP